ncbi:MAG TPA: FkbM family methyltransferase [Puia sp.]|nr:FkbM family methyltransferase [Puia sp.]
MFQKKEKDKIEIYLRKYLDPDKKITVIDAGAHKGDFIDQLKKHYKIQKTVLIEPIAHLANFLKLKYSNENIFVFQNAISDKDFNHVEFRINEYEETSSILEVRSEMKELGNINTRLSKKEKLITRTLDSIAQELSLDIVDLIKIDVQGVEHLVLEGGKNVLGKSRYVWIELSLKPLYVDSSVFHDIYNMMEKNEFILLELSPGHRSPSNELLQVDALFANPKLTNDI